jgi:hypothetical protein
MAQPGSRLRVPPLLAEYWAASRSARYAIIFSLPLLILYEALASLLSHGPGPELRNGADVLVQDIFLSVAGQYAPVAFGVTVLLLSIWYIVRNMHTTRTRLRSVYFITMLAESGLLAVVFMFAVGALTSRVVGAVERVSYANSIVAAVWPSPPPAGPLSQMSTSTKVMLSLGAGLYEELVFRVVLVSLIAFICGKIFGWKPFMTGLTAVVVSALVFAAFHYIGPYGDPLRLDSFVFRFLGGMAFSVVYVLRGFGIVAWTHTLYDLLVVAM